MIVSRGSGSWGRSSVSSGGGTRLGGGIRPGGGVPVMVGGYWVVFRTLIVGFR